MAMDATVRTVVTFKSLAFNVSEHKEYFINPGCFGDDLAKWLGERLRSNGHQAANEPGQEDFGWYLIFKVDNISHCFVVVYRPDDGVWICWLERNRGPLGSLFGFRRMHIQPAAVVAIHEILSVSPQISDVRWFFSRDFDQGREDLAKAEP
jgi:hypothetical protein